jgi:hypothetical protein
MGCTNAVMKSETYYYGGRGSWLLTHGWLFAKNERLLC